MTSTKMFVVVIVLAIFIHGQIIAANDIDFKTFMRCFNNLSPYNVLDSNHRFKPLSQIVQREILFDNHQVLIAPGVTFQFLRPNEEKSFILSKDFWGPLTILLKPRGYYAKFTKLLVNIIWNESVNLTDTVKLITYEGGLGYGFTASCVPPGQYRLDIFPKESSAASVEISTKFQHLHVNWSHLDKVDPVKIRCRSRRQNRHMLIKWDKCNVDSPDIHYCIVINNHRFFKNICEAIANKIVNETFSCNILELLYNNYSTPSGIRYNATRRLDPDGTTIIYTGNRSQQLFKRFKPNMHYYVDIFGIHKKLNYLTFHLGSIRMWHSNKNLSTPLYDGRTGHGKLSQFNDLLTFSFKPVTPSAQILLYVVPCGFGGAISVKIMQQKRLIHELKSIHKPGLHRIKLPSFANLGGRLMIKVMPNNIDEALRTIRIQLTATSLDTFYGLPSFPTNLSLTHLPSMDDCRSVDLLWHPIPDSTFVRYCILVMTSSSYENSGFCGIDQNIFKHPRFQQFHCVYSKNGPSKLERIRITDLSPKTYTVYLTATVERYPKESVKYEPLRLPADRFCNFFHLARDPLRRASNNISNTYISIYDDFNHLN